ncbi:Acyltransferase 3 [Metarhizium guizhouense ARSEF 977]|uniref:Acyltransferase 3 n=1 Tax=Metarhizium guizhouense (strain ARSEF 977) TaxID=1276136 RepID=A0A0B4GVU0_METGA|nr:Acyltransferase 3 [Metarhizium guizhouense ARSEF 977]
MPAQNSPRLLDRGSLEEAMLNADPEAANDGPLQTQWTCAKPSGDTWTSLSRLKSWLWPQAAHRPRALHKTAYLDGLRGFAALLVYWHHHVLWVHNADRLAQNAIFENGFGYESKYHLAALPGVRLLFSGGHFAVSTFFVLSGYVLSIKPLRLIESDDLAGLVDHLASALFRRWLRLFLPVAATMAVYATSWHLLGLWIDGASPQAGWLGEMWFLYCEFKNFSFVFKDGGVPWLSYSMHVWSIPVEFKGSMVVFASLLAFSRCTLTARLWCQVGLVVYFMYIADGWYCAMFVAGMLLSHLDLLAALGRLPRFLARLAPYKTVVCYHMLVLGIYLGGVPCENRELDQLARNRGWYFLSFFKPQAVFDYKWFYLFWAATLLVGSVSHIGWLKRFFETRVCQYLGRISFALYLVHGPLLWTLGDRLYAAVGFKGPGQMEHMPQWVDRFVLPQNGPVGLEFAFVLPHLILLPVTLCAADFVTRAVDRPSVQFAAWVYRKTLPSVPRKHAKA